MKSYLFTYARFILVISGVGMKILELKKHHIKNTVSFKKVVPISSEVCRVPEKKLTPYLVSFHYHPSEQELANYGQ